MKTVLILFTVIVLSANSHAQSASVEIDTPSVGDQCPDFELTDIQYYPKSKLAMSELRGKWVILDFWSVGCRACILSFPKFDSLQREFGKDLQVLFIGKSDKRIRPMYERLRQRYHFMVPSAYDTAIFTQFGIHYTPYTVIVDPTGKIHSIVFPNFINSTVISKLIAGEQVVIPQLKDAFPALYFYELARLDTIEQQQDDSRNVFFKSELSQHRYGMPLGYREDFRKWHWSSHRNNGINISAVDLGSLFRIAFFGHHFINPSDSGYNELFSQPILETKQAYKFQPPGSANPYTYNYKLRVPAEICNDSLLMKTMQNDVENAFNLTCTIEKRTMPYYALQVLPGFREKLLPKGRDTVYPDDDWMTGFRMANLPMRLFVSYIYLNYQLGPHIADETGITGDIDITLKGVLTDIPSLIKTLEKAGLTLVPKRKEMKVMVIRDNVGSPPVVH